jgi:allantoin racemase
VRIWFQVVSSPNRLPAFLAALQQQVTRVAEPGTEVLVRGTQNGALGDQYATLLHYDADEILRLAHKEVVGRGYAAYGLANSLDPALDALRETLDMPVLSLMQVGCSVAAMLADGFGLVVPNEKFGPMYRRVVESHGFGDRLVGTRPLAFDHIASLDAMFTDEPVGTQTVERFAEIAATLVADGAEAVLAPGPVSCLLYQRGVTEVSGARIIDLYSTLLKVSEALAHLADHSGMTTSRRLRYRQPPAQILEEARRLYDL